MSEAATPDIPAEEQAPSISAAAQAYQLAMNQQSTTTTSTTTSSGVHVADIPKDIVMSDSTPDRAAVSIFHRRAQLWKLTVTQSPAILPGATNTLSPAPPRVGTPSRNVNGENTSRAASLHPDPPTMPSQAPPHGAPTRQYLNGKVTGVLLDGMKQLAKEQ